MLKEVADNAGMKNSDISLAVHWYLERALMEDGQAAFHLGKIYQYGWGVTRDIAEAVRWYQRASKLGVAEAKGLSTKLQASMGADEPVAEKNGLALILENYGLPIWLAQPPVIVSVVLVLLLPIFFRRKKGRSKDKALWKI